MTEEKKKKQRRKSKMMSSASKKGQTLAEFMVVIGILAVTAACLFGFFSKHVFGNKQIVDFNHQKFTTAYVLSDSNMWEKVSIKAWKDWEDSDAIQIVTQDGKAIYTHLRNVKLVQE